MIRITQVRCSGRVARLPRCPVSREGVSRTAGSLCRSSLRTDKEVAAIERIVQTGSEHGLNGMVLSAGLDRLDQQPPEYLERLAKVKEFCQAHGVEIIPNIFSAGYGGSVLAYNRNLAAGIPVKDAPFLVKDGEASLSPDRPVRDRQRRIRAVRRESVQGLPIP